MEKPIMYPVLESSSDTMLKCSEVLGLNNPQLGINIICLVQQWQESAVFYNAILLLRMPAIWCSMYTSNWLIIMARCNDQKKKMYY